MKISIVTTIIVGLLVWVLAFLNGFYLQFSQDGTILK